MTSPRIAEGYRKALDILCTQMVGECLGKESRPGSCHEAISNFAGVLPKGRVYTPGPRCTGTMFSYVTDVGGGVTDVVAKKWGAITAYVQGLFVAAQEGAALLAVAAAPSLQYCCAEVQRFSGTIIGTCGVTHMDRYAIIQSSASAACRVTLALSSPPTVDQVMASCGFSSEKPGCFDVPLSRFDHASGYSEGVASHCSTKSVCHMRRLVIAESPSDVTWGVTEEHQ